ncbi:MAG: IS66 family transposase [Candidatus Dormibacteraceae bacterium]
MYEIKASQEELLSEQEKLRARLSRNSSNSSKPPSSDGYGKPNREQRRSSNRKPGKQRGAPGSQLAQVELADEIVTHIPEQCSRCNCDLGKAVVEDTQIRQIFDMPRLNVWVTEHQAQSRRCAKCGELTRAGFPVGVDAAAKYGPRTRALASYMSVFQHLPYDRTRQMFRDVLNIELALGTIVSCVGEAEAGLEKFGAIISQELHNSEVVHFDETGARVKGKLCIGCTRHPRTSSPATRCMPKEGLRRWTRRGF